MFCPKCGDLLMGMPVDGVMQCTKPECKDVKAEVDERFNSTTEALPERDYSIIERLKRPTTDAHVCPHCGAREATTELRQMDQTDEPEVLFLDCMVCGKGWREA